MVYDSINKLTWRQLTSRVIVIFRSFTQNDLPAERKKQDIFPIGSFPLRFPASQNNKTRCLAGFANHSDLNLVGS